jgi:hypothetical protein
MSFAIEETSNFYFEAIGPGPNVVMVPKKVTAHGAAYNQSCAQEGYCDGLFHLSAAVILSTNQDSVNHTSDTQFVRKMATVCDNGYKLHEPG